MQRERRRRWLWIAGLYLGLLAASHGVRLATPPPAVPAGRHQLALAEMGAKAQQVRRVRVAWSEWSPPAPEPGGALPVLLIHGSPGDGSTFDAVGAALGRSRRTLAPDLPGFGDSTRVVADYSIGTHALYLGKLLERLELERVHVVGFSMGGGVSLHLAALLPERIASVTLLSSIGVPELELLGNQTLNHLVHGIQLVALWLVQEATPHFGMLDRFPLNVAYARNFWDSDQRPLRAILEHLSMPVLIVHGENDPLVPPAAALEHHRLVPQSELEMLPGSHFFLFRDRYELSRRLDDFFARVERGAATVRTEASVARVATSRLPFDPSSLSAWTGPAVLAVMLLLALATLMSEDLTCLGAGVLVAQGRLAFFPATLACFLGILLGDYALFWAGRLLGRPIVRLPPFRWWISERAVAESSAWLERRGPLVIFASRFLPGARLPTYLAAGILRTRFLSFAVYFFIAAALWTPAVVALSAWLGQEALERLGDLQHAAVVTVALLAALLLFVRGVALPLLSHRGRRRWVGRLRRVWSWEFWPAWLFYPPVVVWVLWLGLRHRCLTLFTATNPAMPAGGVVGESKHEILERMRDGGAPLPRWRLLEAETPPETRLAELRAFLDQEGLDYPVVLKPDAGQRGAGVAVIRSADQARGYFARHSAPTLLQEYVRGEELGIFYYRYPGEERGQLLAINEKRFPRVRGDGLRTLEELVLDDRRAVAIADVYLRELGERRNAVPAAGEEVQLVEIGAHARGAIFLDATKLATPELVRAMDAIADAFPGFDFGRFDVRVPSRDGLREGRQLTVIEANGVTSEATSLYDPRHSLFAAWSILFRQWRIAFEIGALRRRSGHRPVTLRQLLALLLSYRRQQRRFRVGPSATADASRAPRL